MGQNIAFQKFLLFFLLIYYSDHGAVIDMLVAVDVAHMLRQLKKYWKGSFAYSRQKDNDH